MAVLKKDCLLKHCFRYATLKEISIRDCQRKYNSFLAGNRKKANLSQKQLCAGNAEVAFLVVPPSHPIKKICIET